MLVRSRRLVRGLALSAVAVSPRRRRLVDRGRRAFETHRLTSPVLTGDSVRIRQVERADLLEVFRIEKASFPQPWPFSAFERFLGEPGFLVATCGCDVLGYVVADVTPNHGRDIGHVKDLAVHADARECGIGRALLRRALIALAIRGAALVKLEVREGNDPALRLYRDVGFETIRRVPRYYADGEDALVMVLDVAQWQGARAAGALEAGADGAIGDGADRAGDAGTVDGSGIDGGLGTGDLGFEVDVDVDCFDG
jgi:ribosomal-protein-alanine N-acetyltransferase